MYEVREVNVSRKGRKIPGFERDVVGTENFLTATAATDGDDDEAAAFVSIICEFGDVSFTCCRDDMTGEVNGIGIHADGEDARLALIKSLDFLSQALREETLEVND